MLKQSLLLAVAAAALTACASVDAKEPATVRTVERQPIVERERTIETREVYIRDEDPDYRIEVDADRETDVNVRVRD